MTMTSLVAALVVAASLVASGYWADVPWTCPGLRWSTSFMRPSFVAASETPPYRPVSPVLYMHTHSLSHTSLFTSKSRPLHREYIHARLRVIV